MAKVEVTYQCKRCFMRAIRMVDRDKAKKTIKCVMEGCPGRMRLMGLPAATGFRTKSVRNK